MACACAYCIWQAINLERADYSCRKDTRESVRKAIAIAPDSSGYYMRLSQLDPDNARALLEEAVRLNPYNAMADIELGLLYEADGDYKQAEARLLAAFAIDRTYIPRWSLANFYFRRDNQTEFWKWAQSAAEMPSSDVVPLFQLCWHASPDPQKIAHTIVGTNPDVINQYISFLIDKQELPSAVAMAPQLVKYGSPDANRYVLMGLIYKLLLAKDGDRAKTVWDAMVSRNWVPADGETPYNGSFSREPLNEAFDWILGEFPGLHSWTGSNGLNSEFNGDEPENSWVVQQAIVLKPGRYKMDYTYQTSGVSPGSGLKWTIDDVRAWSPIGISSDLSSDAPKQDNFEFTVPGDSSLFQLRLVYRRALGTTPISGKINIASVRIHPA
jgi:hypothetical protein